ncbi:uncharacterized protein LOC142348495 [Convolutriloba macropyga]|uniref:uncharacterized protein LOC142348495 n=1 Tax=Convolutriloba macropyga TaxID=536237 RepID=UPI003F527AC8
MAPGNFLSNSDDFDIYVDQVRFSLDSCVLLKVSCKIIYAGESFPEFVITPSAASECRSLTMEENKFHANPDRLTLNPDASLIFRVSGLMRRNNQLCVAGMGAMALFQQSGSKEEQSESGDQNGGNEDSNSGSIILRTGGHQLRVFQGEPEQKGAPDETSFSVEKAVPSLTVTLRIEPHTDEMKKAPKYSSGYYSRGNFFVTDREKLILAYYRKHSGPIQQKLRDECLEAQKLDFAVNCPEKLDDESLLEPEDIREGSTDAQIQQWINDRLDRQHPWNRGKDLVPMSLQKIMGYDEESGVGIRFTKMFNVDTKQRYVCVAGALVNPAQAVPVMVVTNSRHNFDSPLSYQEWFCNDEECLIKPQLVKNVKLIVIVYGLDWEYTPEPDYDQPGRLFVKSSTDEVALTPQNVLGWSVVDLVSPDFCVNSGSHFLPLYGGDAPLKNKSLRGLPTRDWIEANLSREKIAYLDPKSVIRVDIYNGINPAGFSSISPDKSLMQVSGKQVAQGFEKAINSAQGATGATLGSRVIATLPRTDVKLGKKSAHYNKAVDIYERTMNQKYFEELKTVLRCENINII